MELKRVNLNLLIAVAMILLFATQINGQSQECEKFVEQLIDNIAKLNISSIPLPSIMYSGITTNNPGQFYECQQVNFSYYLVTIKNLQTNVNSFTGICVPSQCSKEDMKIALDFWHCEVYDFPQIEEDPDALALIGIVLISLWMAVLIVWSIVLSCKEPQINEYVQKEKEEKSAAVGSVNSLLTTMNRGTDQDQGNRGNANGNSQSFHLFNYYEGYRRIFLKPASSAAPKRRNLMGAFLFLATLSVLISTEFSYKQAISSNPVKAYALFDSLLGIFVCNVEVAFSVIMFVLGMRLAYGVYNLTSFYQIGRYFFDQLLRKWVFLLLVSMAIYGFMSEYTDRPLAKYWSLNFGQDCPTNMWQSWFLFRHLQPDTKVCLPWLWILQAELFLTLISAPFIIIFRIRKSLGYGLLGLICAISTIIAFSVLDSQGVVFQPTKLFNMHKEYTIGYQTNTLVRAGAFYFGVLFGFFVIQGLDKVEGKQRTTEYKLAKRVRKEKFAQIGLQGAGIAIMLLIYCLISVFFQLSSSLSDDQESAHWFIALTPLVFLVGFALFILPSFWQVENAFSTLVTRVFSWTGWNSLERISPCMLVVGPAVMGFTTFSTQNSIYYDLETIIVYLLGNLLLTYVCSLVLCAAVENQIGFLGNWLGVKVFGKQNKYSQLLLEE